MKRGIVARLRGKHMWKRLVPAAAVGLLAPFLAYAAEVGDYGLWVFTEGDPIQSATFNDNFAVLGEHVDHYESTITVDGYGNVGIGITSPVRRLQVDGEVEFDGIGGGSGILKFGASHGQTGIVGYSNSSTRNDIAWWDDYLGLGSSGQTLVITGAGNVGIGTTTPTSRLQVHGKVAFSAMGDGNGLLEFGSPRGQTGMGGYSNGGTRNDIIWWDEYLGLGSSGQTLVITGAGNVGIGTTSPQQRLHVAGNVTANDYYHNSDLRMKSDVAPLEGALHGILCLQGVTYRWSDSSAPQGVQLGLIAQEVENCFPELVSTDENGFKSVAYSRLVAPLAEAMKEQQRMLSAQQQVIAALQRAGSEQQDRIDIQQEKIAIQQERIANLQRSVKAHQRQDILQQEQISALEARLARLEALLDIRE